MGLLITSCTSVPIKDEVFYGNKGALGAVSFHTLASGQNDVSKAQWDQILLTTPLICSSVSTFTDLKAAFEKVCSMCQSCCDYQTTASLNDLFAKVASVKIIKK